MQVAFNVMLPCMLFTKVASTLASSFEPAMFVVPVLAVFQVVADRFFSLLWYLSALHSGLSL